jgi:hypothetical protein
MAGELLRDRSFAPVRSLSTGASNLFLLDFVADSFQVDTTVFSSGAGKEAIFRVRVKGRIRGDKFHVFDPVTDQMLFAFTRTEADKPDFLEREFPLLAHETRKDLTPSSERRNIPAPEVIDLTLGVAVSDTIITVRVQKVAANSSLEVKNSTSGAPIMRLPLSSLNNIPRLAETVGQYLSTNTSARQPVESTAGTSEPDKNVTAVPESEQPSERRPSQQS